jgi:hypothetical protein
MCPLIVYCRVKIHAHCQTVRYRDTADGEFHHKMISLPPDLRLTGKGFMQLFARNSAMAIYQCTDLEDPDDGDEAK